MNPNGQPLTVPINGTPFGQPYINTSVFADPVSVNRYRRGNTSFRLSQLRAPWMLQDDFSLQKNFQPLESMRIQFRAEFLNAFNRTHWGNIDTNAASPSFGIMTGATDWFSPRKIQFGIRADF
jgi:hypothetical protein